MQRRWWIAVVAVIGIVFAILLFPRPDTGGDPLAGRVPPSRTVNADEGATEGENRIPPTHMIPGPRPEAAEMLAKRSTPEAIYANLLVGPIAGMKYTIRKIEPQTDEVPAITAKIDSVVTELRAVRTDPDARPWTDIEATVESLITMVNSSTFGPNPDVQKSIARARDLMSQYHTNPTGPTAPPTSGTPSTPTTTPTTSGTQPPEEYE